MEMGFLLDVVKHPNKKKYEHQSIFVVEYEKYVYLVPFVEDDERVFKDNYSQQKNNKKIF